VETAPGLESTATSPPVQRALVPSAKDAAGGAVAPAPGQLQRFEAELSLRVDDVGALSDATKRAQQIARNHDGSVASLQYDAPSSGVGTAQITLRIPTAKVESALAELSQLGTILGQRYGIEDLQQQADSLQTQIEQTQRRIAQILTQLESSTLSAENRVVLQSRLNAARQKLTGLRQAMQSTRAEAATSTVYVTLTTEEIEPAAVGGSRLDGIKDVLAWEAVALLYALVVAGPIVLLAGLIWLVVRLLRRRETARLLEQN
jgi:pyruvate/2-oxoglutarate dehydrogenase complex dihydrolipoamide acyltransferase (E2) component